MQRPQRRGERSVGRWENKPGAPPPPLGRLLLPDRGGEDGEARSTSGYLLTGASRCVNEAAQSPVTSPGFRTGATTLLIHANFWVKSTIHVLLKVIFTSGVVTTAVKALKYFLPRRVEPPLSRGAAPPAAHRRHSWGGGKGDEPT